MAKVIFGGTLVNTSGELPKIGAVAPDAILVDKTLQSTTLHGHGGIRVLNIFPSVATPVCQASVRRFHDEISKLPGVTLLNISKDLPFAQTSFCAAKGLDDVKMLSTFRGSFGRDFGLEFIESPFEGLLSRAVLILDANDKVLYGQQAQSTDEEPNYEPVLAALKQATDIASQP